MNAKIHMVLPFIVVTLSPYWPLTLHIQSHVEFYQNDFVSFNQCSELVLKVDGCLSRAQLPEPKPSQDFCLVGMTLNRKRKSSY